MRIRHKKLLNIYRWDMAKLYFKYGAMGSSKTAQALITRFNYQEKGMRVWLADDARLGHRGGGVHQRVG